VWNSSVFSQIEISVEVFDREIVFFDFRQKRLIVVDTSCSSDDFTTALWSEEVGT
jgi:hypothetical protein